LGGGIDVTYQFLLPAIDLETDFQTHAQKWLEEMRFSSSVEEMAMYPSYQRIIGMGRQVVPLILRELRDRPNHWFWALNAITGEDPAQGEETQVGARDAWLGWGRQQGLID
jgi:hypothetical protein